MDAMTNKSNKLQLLTLVIPLLFSLLFAVFGSVIAAILWAVSVFTIISFVPVFDRRENLWTFLCVAMSGIPANIFFIGRILEWDYFFFTDGLLSILYSVMLYSLLFSIEEIAFGVVIRFFHPRQYKLNV